MALLHRSLAAPALPHGILANRRLANPALLRVFSRARRHGRALLLLRVASEGGMPLPAAFLEAVAAEIRIGDLAWCEPGAELLLLLEDTEEGAAVAARLRERAAVHGLSLRLHQGQFPRQSLTLEALLTEAGWRT